MARIDLVHADNVDGPWFVDTRCIRCDAARHWAPGLVEMDASGLSYVARQPESPEEIAALWRAAVACPTQSIGTTEARRPSQPAFPFELTPGVYALGHNARESFGAHSYLVPRPDGNLMTDSPRFTRGLAELVDDLGGVRHVLLSHRGRCCRRRPLGRPLRRRRVDPRGRRRRRALRHCRVRER